MLPPLIKLLVPKHTPIGYYFGMEKKAAVTDAILFILEKAVDGYVRIEDFTYHPHFYLSGERFLRKSSLSQALRRLRERGLIEEEKDEGKIIYKLTEKGRDRAILKSTEEKDWDGRWRVVVFDIPEKRRSVREILRRKLIEWGFRKWQKSVWASQKNCTKPLRDFIKQIGVEDWVLVIESDNIGFNPEL